MAGASLPGKRDQQRKVLYLSAPQVEQTRVICGQEFVHSHAEGVSGPPVDQSAALLTIELYDLRLRCPRVDIRIAVRHMSPSRRPYGRSSLESAPTVRI
jgi:hypothetical protein